VYERDPSPGGAWRLSQDLGEISSYPGILYSPDEAFYGYDRLIAVKNFPQGAIIASALVNISHYVVDIWERGFGRRAAEGFRRAQVRPFFPLYFAILIILWLYIFMGSGEGRKKRKEKEAHVGFCTGCSPILPGFYRGSLSRPRPVSHSLSPALPSRPPQVFTRPVPEDFTAYYSSQNSSWEDLYRWSDSLSGILEHLTVDL
jgi:hypothetical protein